ncbi:elongation factor G [Longispora albida]|uniref:elongation factor G n=1 Tax=Longispora albida TaxID=203523 RepID=UPI00037B0F98|nr:TetM/TetW/TetO/TetS family tetracycline resistance ribosomal protection protein [Longispora albida]
MRTLNIGILAHVDAGKTSLTERLLFETGVIRRIGSVDSGSTQTDTLDLERRRGITIQAAVVSFMVGDVRVNLIDTPGHPDFIAEVERALAVLDGVVLVVSAVEGVQPQTRVLMRTLARLGLPVILFANKIDRMGARYESLLADIRHRLTPAVLPLSTVAAIGTREAVTAPCEPDAAMLAEHSDELLAAYVDDAVPADLVRRELARQTASAIVYPVFFGSAITGEGVPELLAGVRELLPSAGPGPDGELRATVFKIERGRAGEKIAYVRVFSGELSARRGLPWRRPGTAIRGEVRPTAVRIFDGGSSTVDGVAGAGSIARVHGLRELRIGDQLGVPSDTRTGLFAPPSLETAVRSDRPVELYAALRRLAESDPLISIRAEDGAELTIRLYGEVQKEVIASRLAEEHGLAVEFAETRPICVERPVGTGSFTEMISGRPDGFLATVGLRVEPGPGYRYGLAVEAGSLLPPFHHALEEAIPAALRQGLHGWQVIGCHVTLTHSGYWAPVSSAADFRRCAPLVVLHALREAGTEVLEPVHRFELEVPADRISVALSRLADAHAELSSSVVRGETAVLGGTIAAGRVHGFEQQLPGLTQGDYAFWTEFGGYRPVHGEPPRRARTDLNPLHREEYVARLAGRM